MKKSHVLIFVGSRGNKKRVDYIKDLDDAGRPKTDQEIIKEASKLIYAFCSERNFKIYYTRVWNSDGKTIFDVGSHTEFFHLIPAVDFHNPEKEDSSYEEV